MKENKWAGACIEGNRSANPRASNFHASAKSFLMTQDHIIHAPQYPLNTTFISPSRAKAGHAPPSSSPLLAGSQRSRPRRIPKKHAPGIVPPFAFGTGLRWSSAADGVALFAGGSLGQLLHQPMLLLFFLGTCIVCFCIVCFAIFLETTARFPVHFAGGIVQTQPNFCRTLPSAIEGVPSAWR